MQENCEIDTLAKILILQQLDNISSHKAGFFKDNKRGIMNQLEKAIINGVVMAQKKYENMTDWWLSHGPEYFITCAVANNIADQNGFSVFPESSPKKLIKERSDPPKRGPQPKSNGQRFDLVVWHKSSYDVRAIIEIKRAYNIEPLRKDKDKIFKYMDKNDFVKNGYLLVYTEAKREETLPTRLRNWADRLECQLVGSENGKDDDDDDSWRWAVGLLKLK